MEIISQKSQINASAEQVFEFLSDCNNIYHLLPQDKITDWTADVDSCSFKVTMAKIALVVEEHNAHSSIKMKSGEGTPFPFHLDIIITETTENQCEGYLHFNGEVNAFLKMMVEKPLTNLFDYMAHKLQKQFE